ncbi:hypothetical protein GCM10011369_34880 [Neiella marina]|uniref:Outer membrane protein beta-barrel domain-containing protein n=1 Tax=Neiella marina TaxID=508461 RepID=A0A8J2XRN2_9GAMM|nr:hypothetical protein [Neiella marina]GGA89729.1 hypothetical protein GCM10011369_34880 [Neiella marina]
MKRFLTAAISTLCIGPCLAVDLLPPMMLDDNEVQLGAAVLYGEESNGDKSWAAMPMLAYGVTDDFTIGLLGVRYRFINQLDETGSGLELTTGAGLTGYRETSSGDDAFGYGADLSGRYLFDAKTALLFAMNYNHWDEEKRKDRKEIVGSIGVQRHLIDAWSVAAMYSYHHLEDFTQDQAHSANLGLNYAYSPQTDLGLFVHWTDFDSVRNGYKSDSSLEKAIGGYISYRF